jgi:hypothetical protein
VSAKAHLTALSRPDVGSSEEVTRKGMMVQEPWRLEQEQIAFYCVSIAFGKGARRGRWTRLGMNVAFALG